MENTTTTTETQNITIQEKRQMLIYLSEEARLIQETEAPEMTINEILVQEFYSDEKHQEFNTFNQWKAQGYSVKKGEKAFMVWGKKRQGKEATAEQEAQHQAQESEEKTFEFFPICFLFSNAQVEPTKKKKNA